MTASTCWGFPWGDPSESASDSETSSQVSLYDDSMSRTLSEKMVKKDFPTQLCTISDPYELTRAKLETLRRSPTEADHGFWSSREALQLCFFFPQEAEYADRLYRSLMHSNNELWKNLLESLKTEGFDYWSYMALLLRGPPDQMPVDCTTTLDYDARNAKAKMHCVYTPSTVLEKFKNLSNVQLPITYRGWFQNLLYNGQMHDSHKKARELAGLIPAPSNVTPSILFPPSETPP